MAPSESESILFVPAQIFLSAAIPVYHIMIMTCGYAQLQQLEARTELHTTRHVHVDKGLCIWDEEVNVRPLSLTDTIVLQLMHASDSRFQAAKLLAEATYDVKDV